MKIHLVTIRLSHFHYRREFTGQNQSILILCTLCLPFKKRSSRLMGKTGFDVKKNFSNRFCILSLITIGILRSGFTLAQSTDKRVDYQSWTDITLTYNKSLKFSIGGDVGTRGIYSNRNWNQFYIRPTISYTISPLFKLAGGVGGFGTFTPLNSTYELRLFQDYLFAWPKTGFINFNHRLRFEQRFFFYQNIENDFSMRGRYLIGVKTKGFKLIGKEKNFYLSTMWEVFFPVGKIAPEIFVNNQRLYSALGFSKTKSWSFELHYIWQKSRLLSEDGFKSQENVIRLRVFHTIKLTDKE